MRPGRGVAQVAEGAESGAVLFAFAVPGLLVVVLGYVVGYEVTDWLVDVTGADLPASVPEIGGWTTGGVLLVVVTAVLAVLLRRHRSGWHQK